MSTTRSRFLKNTSWIIAGNIVQAVLSFVMSFLLARYLMPDNYGLLNYSASIVAIFSSFCGLGFADTSIKFIVEDPEHEGVILGTGILLRLVASAISTVAVFVIVSLIGSTDHQTLLWISVLQMGGVMLQSFSLLSQWFQSRLQSQIYIFASLIAYLVVSVFKIICLANHANLLWFAGANILEYSIVALFLVKAYRKSSGQEFRFDWNYGKEMLKKSYHFIISGLMIIAYNHEDRIMLGSMIGEYYTGIYTVAQNLCTSWTFVLGAIISSAAPIIYSLNNHNEPLFERRLRQLNLTVGVVSFTAAALITILANWIILFFYGDAYRESIAPLAILSWYSMFNYLGIIRTTWATCKNLQKYEKWLSLSGLICNFALNYLLIPPLGVVGASIATLVTQFVVNFIAPWFIPDLRPYMQLAVNGLLWKDTVSKTEIKNMLLQIKNRKRHSA